jgi:hypothetical protein
MMPALFAHTLYRSGALTPAGDYTTNAPRALIADALRPEGRVGRAAGLFCSLTLAEMATWRLANLSLRRSGYVADAREIRYRGPQLFAYPVAMWDITAVGWSTDRDLVAYWQSGAPVQDVLADPDGFLNDRDINGYERRIEVLIDPQHITSTRPVSDKRLVLAADISTAERLEQSVRRRAWSQGRTWRDYRAERTVLLTAV